MKRFIIVLIVIIGVVGFIGCTEKTTTPKSTEPTKEFDVNVLFKTNTVNQGENTSILYDFKSIGTNQRITNLKFRFDFSPIDSMKLLDSNGNEKTYFEYSRAELKPDNGENLSIDVIKTNNKGFVSAVAKVTMKVTGNFEDGTEIDIEKTIYLTIGKIENS